MYTEPQNPPNTHVVSALAFERMVTAVEKVRQRLQRAVHALEKARIPYAVIEDHAVAAWVGEVDESAVRNAADVDILIRRTDVERAKSAFADGGFVYQYSNGIDLFLDGPSGRPRDAVRIIFAGEKVRAEYCFDAPDVDETIAIRTFRVLDLEALLRMKLTSFRHKDQMHVRDLADVGLVDNTWLERLPPELAARLKELLDNPEG